MSFGAPKFDDGRDWRAHHRVMDLASRLARVAVSAALVGAVVACGGAATSAPSSKATASATPSPAPTKPFASVVQPQLPLPTTVRWAIDKGSPDDPQHRSLLVLFYDGTAQGWRVVDASGTEVFRVPIAGSGIFGPETCVARARQANEVETWVSLDEMLITRFAQEYRTYRAVAEGVPRGSVTLAMTDTGCRAV